MAASKLRQRSTPGVYLTELPAFPPSIVGVETAVPIFIGYTDFATNPTSKKQVYLQAIEITSMADYYSYFGGSYDAKYAVTVGTEADFSFQATDTKGAVGFYNVTDTETVRFNLFNALKLFYDNGGGNCFVVSVANYGGQKSTAPYTGAGVPVAWKDFLEEGLKVAKDKVGPTMLVMPDACLLPDADYARSAQAMLDQAAALQDRVAILDLPGVMDPATWTKDGLKAQQAAFCTDIAPSAASFSYGTAYAPALETTVLSSSDVDFTNLQANQAGSDLLKDLLTAQANSLYGDNPAKLSEVMGKLAIAFPTAVPVTGLSDDQLLSLNQYLTNALPLLREVEDILINELNVAPPSGVMAGVWSRNDSNRGVWNAPANMTAASILSPKVLLTDAEQGDYNVPLNGNAINILRAFVNRGTVVWGARTLDGNSNDYRYIQVRRTLVYIEQSIKTALQPFVFAANDGQTWVTVTGMISNFLTGLWSQGGLMGDKASDAFSVQCGLGSTMTSQDILNGYMVVSVTLQMVHPAEFIELTFTQQMQGS